MCQALSAFASQHHTRATSQVRVRVWLFADAGSSLQPDATNQQMQQTDRVKQLWQQGVVQAATQVCGIAFGSSNPERRR
jgi:intracellular sulfur oxidation DsrE/DsrF family protein